MARNQYPAPTDAEIERMTLAASASFRVDDDDNVYVVNPDGSEIPMPAAVGIPGAQGDPGYTPVKGVDYFDGEAGKDGEDGEDGYTPIKGVDYFDGEDSTVPGPRGEAGPPGDTGPSPYVYAKVHVTGASGTVTVTFPDGAFSSQPIVTATVIAGTASNYSYRVELLSDPTPTQAVFRTTRTRNTQFSLLGLTGITLTEAAPSIKIMVMATKASG